MLSPTNAKILVEAFEKRLPKHIDEVESVDLPMFLLGVLSAANWHAIRTSDSVLAAELAKSQLLHSLQSSDLTSDLPSSTQDPFTSNLPISPQHNLPLIDSLQSPSPISDPSWNSHPVSPQYDSPSVQSPHQEAWTDFVSQSTSAAKRVSSLEQDSRDRDQIEAARSLIALTGALMTFILLVFGASIQAAIMGIIFFVILCAWPYIHPLAAAWLRAFRRETANARSRANELETENRKT